MFLYLNFEQVNAGWKSKLFLKSIFSITSVILVAIGPSEFLMIPLLSEFFGSYFVRNESFHKCDELLLVWKESDWWKQ